MADHTANQVRALAAASDQPFASREEINPSITRVTRYFRYCPAMRQAAQAVLDLVGQARILTGLIEDIKCG